MSDLLFLLGLSIIGSVLALVGGLIFLFSGKWGKTIMRYSVPFASGVLIALALIGLIPESTHLIGDVAFPVVLAAFIGSYLFEMFAFNLHHHDHDDHTHSHSEGSSSLVIIGDTIHNFIDGVAIAAAYFVNPALGVVTAFSTLLHEIPHEIADFGILLKAGYSKKKVFLINLVSSFATVLGVLTVLYLGADNQLSGILLAVAGGMFMYLGASDFLPKALDAVDKKKAVGMLLIGVISIYMTLSIVPHTHESHDGEHSEDEYHESVDEHAYDEEFHEEEEEDHADETQIDEVNIDL